MFSTLRQKLKIDYYIFVNGISVVVSEILAGVITKRRVGRNHWGYPSIAKFPFYKQVILIVFQK